MLNVPLSICLKSPPNIKGDFAIDHSVICIKFTSIMTPAMKRTFTA